MGREEGKEMGGEIWNNNVRKTEDTSKRLILTILGSHSSEGWIPVRENSSAQGRLQNVAP